MSLSGTKNAGINSVQWQLRRPYTNEEKEKATSRFARRQMAEGKLVSPGDYIAVLEIGGVKLQIKFKILPVPGME